MIDADTLLNDFLSAGEWTDIEVVAAPGVMGSRNWAILGKARSIRERTSVFIKLILAASPSAGVETTELTNPARLDALRTRIEQMRTTTMPVVRIVSLDRKDAGLLVAMEPVTTLHEYLKSNLMSASEAGSLIRDLAPADSWHHFDLCPKNLGRTEAGRFVLIDLDSIYFGTSGRFEITTTFCKHWRLPKRLLLALQTELAAGTTVSRSTALEKYTFELLLAAAEGMAGSTALEPLVDALNKGLQPAHAAVAAGTAGQHMQLVVEAILACARGDAVDLAALASDLAAAKDSDVRPGRQSVAVDPQSAGTGVNLVSSNEPSTQVLPEQFRSRARAMRADDLSRLELIEYAQQLELVAERAPQNRRVWDELQYVYVGYLRDMVSALRVTRRCLTFHAQAEETQRWERILALRVGSESGGQ